jgi:hypothetical protein
MRTIQTAAALCVIFATSLVACHQKSGTVSVEKVRELNEIPIPQLRVFLKGYAGDWRAASQLGTSSPEPPSQKPVPPEATLISLPPVAEADIGALSVRAAIAARRSIRHFSNAPLSTQELGYLLWATQGVTATDRNDSGEIISETRAAPSAGGRYPLETYLAINRVDGLQCGL